MRINDRTVTGNNPTLPRGKSDCIFFDDDIAGLGLRVREKGSRTFVFQYWHGGRARRMTLGTFPKLSANAARELVAGVGGLAAKVAVGQDPAGDKAAGRERTADTVETIKDLYLAAQAKRLKPRSYLGVELHLNVHAKPLHSMPVDKVSRRDVADLLTTLATESGPVSANRVRSSFGDVQLGVEGGQGRNQSGGLHQQGKRETARPRSRRS